ncbi:hypothetical protein Syun_025283 [Stephania yunnanensis]|uniref:Cytochrome P450 n=1 Tax=Stephania yunnanensis TaxID=152371 RepID=A0AAP0EWY6_9MAGN
MGKGKGKGKGNDVLSDYLRDNDPCRSRPAAYWCHHLLLTTASLSIPNLSFPTTLLLLVHHLHHSNELILAKLSIARKQQEHSNGANNILALFSFTLVLLYLLYKPKHNNLPPALKPAWPLLGNLPIPLDSNGTTPLYITLTKLAQTYDPLIFVILGTSSTIVTSTTDAAMEILKTNDGFLSRCHISICFRIKDLNKNSSVQDDSTDNRKLLQKIARMEIFGLRMLKIQKPARGAKVLEI